MTAFKQDYDEFKKNDPEYNKSLNIWIFNKLS